MPGHHPQECTATNSHFPPLWVSTIRRPRYFKNQLHLQNALILEMSQQKQQSLPGHSQLQDQGSVFNYIKTSTQTEQSGKFCFYFKILSWAREAQEFRAEALPGAVEGLFSNSFDTFHDVILVLGAGGCMAAHLGQVHLCRQEQHSRWAQTSCTSWHTFKQQQLTCNPQQLSAEGLQQKLQILLLAKQKTFETMGQLSCTLLSVVCYHTTLLQQQRPTAT